MQSPVIAVIFVVVCFVSICLKQGFVPDLAPYLAALSMLWSPSWAKTSLAVLLLQNLIRLQGVPSCLALIF